MNDHKDAWRELESMLKVIVNPELDRKVQSAYEAEGYQAALKVWLREEGKDDVTSYSNAPDRARLLTFAGDYSGAVRELQRGLKMRDGWMVFVETDPAFEALHSNPAYQDVVRQVRSASPTS